LGSSISYNSCVAGYSKPTSPRPQPFRRIYKNRKLHQRVARGPARRRPSRSRPYSSLHDPPLSFEGGSCRVSKLPARTLLHLDTEIYMSQLDLSALVIHHCPKKGVTALVLPPGLQRRK
jgi:hypothetical protein